MKYDLASDLHIDISNGGIDWEIQKAPDSDVLIVAGDIANTIDLTVEELVRAAKVYNTVMFVDGNHEHYSNFPKLTIEDTVNELRTLIQDHNNIIYLNPSNSVHIIDDVAFIGCNGWYDFKFTPASISRSVAISTWMKHSNDKYCNFSKGEPTCLAIEHADIIVKEVKKLQGNNSIKKIVIITHTSPHRDGVTWKEHDSNWNILNGAYGNSVMANVWKADVNKKIVHAVYGHCHAYSDFYAADGIRFIANPRGYAGYERIADSWTLCQFNTNDERGVVVSAFGKIER